MRAVEATTEALHMRRQRRQLRHACLTEQLESLTRESETTNLLKLAVFFEQQSHVLLRRPPSTSDITNEISILKRFSLVDEQRLALASRDLAL